MGRQNVGDPPRHRLRVEQRFQAALLTACAAKLHPLRLNWLSGCLKQVELNTLLNKRGTTWRKLTPEEQAQANTEDGAIALMMAHPSVIKRPVLLLGEQIAVGFDAANYAALFQAA